MRTNYNEFVDEYVKTEESVFRKYIERFSFLNVLGDVQMKSVIDLACGLGTYSRIVKNLGASYVVGVDISEKMIEWARAMEVERPLGIKYLVRDVAKLERVGLFDVATAAYLFPYAQTKQMLEDMARSIAGNLMSRGRLIALTIDPDIGQKRVTATEKFGIYVTIEEENIREGTPVTVVLHYPDQDERITLSTYRWSKESYEDAMYQAGFREVKWHPLQVSYEGIEEYGQDYWQEYMANTHLTIIECLK